MFTHSTQSLSLSTGKLARGIATNASNNYVGTGSYNFDGTNDALILTGFNRIDTLTINAGWQVTLTDGTQISWFGSDRSWTRARPGRSRSTGPGASRATTLG